MNCRFLFFIAVFFLVNTYALSQENIKLEELYNEADVLFQKGNLKESELLYNKILSLDPESALAYNNLALIESSDDKRLKDSIIHFMKAIKLDPNYADAFNNLGVICYKIGQMDRAEQYIKKAIELDPENAKNYFSLGWIYASGEKKYDKAIEALNKSLELDPKQPDAHYVLGMAYIHLGKKLEVLDQITSLRSLNKENLAESLEDLIRVPSSSSDMKSSHSGINKDVKMTYDVTMVKKDEENVEEPKEKASGKGVKLKAKIPVYPQKFKLSGGQSQNQPRHARIKGKTGSSVGKGTIESGRIQLKLSGSSAGSTTSSATE